MSDLFYYDRPNPVRIRGQDCKFENVFQKNFVTNEYERVGGGGGGGDLPPYLKANSIDIDDPGNLGTELTGTALTFGDSMGNVSINLAKAKVLDQLKSVTAAAAGRKYLLWDAPTQNFVAGDILGYLETSSIDFGGGSLLSGSMAKVTANGGDEYAELQAGTGNVSLTMETTNVDSKMALNEYSLSFANKAGTATSTLNRANLKQVEDLHTMLEAAPEAGANNVLIGYSPSTKKLVRNPSSALLFTSSTAYLSLTPTSLNFIGATSSANIGQTSIRVGPSAQWISLSAAAAVNPVLALKKSGVTVNLEHEDVQTTNKLKALAAGIPGPDSKMVVFDAVTKAFTHATIPSGGASVPDYVKPTKLVIPKPPGGSTEYHIELQNTAAKKLILTADYLYMTGEIGAFTKDARIDFPQFKRLAESSAPTFLKWSPTSSTLILAPPAQWNAGTSTLDYNDVPINSC
jgi:hypothetical protein